MKYAISFLGILLLVICGTLFLQYQVFSNKLDTGEGDFTYTQEIEITYRSGSLDIRHHLHNLSNQAIEIDWPNLAVSTDCFLESKTSCDRLSKDKTKFEASSSTNASLSYTIPLEGGLKTNELLKNIFVVLKNGQAAYSTVHISTDKEVEGQWITGLPLIGQQSLSMVNYTMFGGTGDISEIYWQSGVMSIQKATDLLAVYSHKPLSKEISDQLKAETFLNEDPIVLVQGKNIPDLQGKRIFFLNELSIASLQEKVILPQIRTQYGLDGSPQWVSEVIASFLTETAIGSDKSVGIVKTLTNQMSDVQKLSWIGMLNDLKGSKVTLEKLDEQLSKVFGLHTEFFAMNEESARIFPILFNDERDVYVGNELKKDVKAILKDGQVLYPLDSVLKVLGYQTSVGKNGYYVQNETQKFRFPQGYGFYVYNNQRYNTISEPLTVIADSFYIEETWLQRLFNVEIQRNESSITIRQQQ
ncbi:stalk domain-containing protein [Ureibacillus aquaedulcis]|uniref:RNA polymerase II n=1 Tax=Ureibacillus aquaedulcis TaxID=3058421 RepID=A0ABT8GME4_9BACL|nr:RNA polymerase II [Ureibacillus sp. BA0131]MDN4492404.1 RNA polymerase II [Ureibacillus sp. BA0131]